MTNSANNVNDDLLETIEDLVVEVRMLRHEVRARPTSEAVQRRRHQVFLTTFLLILSLVTLKDYHSEHCGPGARVEVAIEALLEGGVNSADEFRVFSDQVPQGWCDVAFPFHGPHRHGSSWPTAENVFGYTLYGFFIAWAGVRSRYPREKTDAPKVGT